LIRIGPECRVPAAEFGTTVADRLLSVTCTLLEQQTVFDPTYKVHEAAGA
jgi:hypothetical protein